jgi:hypothetical protein
LTAILNTHHHRTLAGTARYGAIPASVLAGAVIAAGSRGRQPFKEGDEIAVWYDRKGY